MYSIYPQFDHPVDATDYYSMAVKTDKLRQL